MSNQEQNEMQKIAGKSRTKLQRVAQKNRLSIIEWYTMEIEDGENISYYSKDMVPFDPAEWYNDALQVTNTAIVDSVEAGLNGLYAIASIKETNQYFENLTIDGVTLSSRLRDSATYAQTETINTINKHLKSKTTFRRLSKELTRKRVSKGDLPKYLKELRDSAVNTGGNTKRLKSAIYTAEKRILQLAQKGAPTKDLQRAYTRVVDTVKKGDIATLNKSLQSALDTKAMYNNDRIARTEIARAHAMAFKRQVVDHPNYEDGEVYIKSLLSPRHNVVDICDFHAGADLYNVGKGVYPANEAPAYPYHPNCLCSQVILSKDIDKRKVRYSKERKGEYLSSQSENRRNSIENSIKNNEQRKLIPLPKKLLE